MSTPEKLKSKKWQQAVSTIDWLTTQLPMTARFQVYTFNQTTAPLIAESEGKWLDAGNVDTLNAVVDRLRQVVPQKGTSLYHAFGVIRKVTPAPDNIFVLTDGLPTMGKEIPWLKKVSGKRRLNLFREAVRLLPANVPVNIILYPMEGDPMAASAYWRLATLTKGSFFSPSRAPLIFWTFMSFFCILPLTSRTRTALKLISVNGMMLISTSRPVGSTIPISPS